MLNFYVILILIGSVQAVVLSIAMLGRIKEPNSTHRWLIALCILVAISLAEGAIDIAGLEQQYIHLSVLILPTNALFLPLYYAYISNMVGNKLKSSFFLHFTPTLFLVLIITPAFSLGNESLVQLLNDNLQSAFYNQWILITFIVLLVIMIGQGAYYIPACFKCFSGYNKLIREQLSFNERVSLSWLKVMTVSLGFVWFMLIITHLTGELFGDYLVIALHVITALLAIGLNVFGLQQESIFKKLGIDLHKLTEYQTYINTSEKNKYQRSSLDRELAEKLYQSTIKFMQIKQPFLDNKLSLSSLARSLDLPTHYLSQIINQIEKQNFFEFINRYRVQFARNLLLSSDDTVLKIAMDSGFNSKTTFYKAFKKETSMSPLEYRRQNI